MNKRLWRRRMSALTAGALVALVLVAVLLLTLMSCTREPVRPNSSPLVLQSIVIPTLEAARGCIEWGKLPDGSLDVRCDVSSTFRLYIDLEVRGPGGVVLESRTQETFVSSAQVTPTSPVTISLDMDGLALGDVWARPRWARPFEFDRGIVGVMSCGSDQADDSGFVLCRWLYQHYIPAVIAVIE